MLFVIASIYIRWGKLVTIVVMHIHHLGLLIFLLLANWSGAADKVDFNREVRPILAAKCFACHGPDEKSREAKLRLDTHDGATRDLGGYAAIVPGDADDSELVLRIFSDDRTDRMPPAKSKKTLTEKEKQTLKQWIAEGASYDRHWAFVPPKGPAVPIAGNDQWPRHPIDHFVLARLRRANLKPSPEADRYTLVRRLYLDLIGLPPTPEEADAFVNDKDPKAYEKLVDQLLASKHYGERWARLWLDLGRYSDTNGYEKDRARSIWPYRDWVIRALNADMPFDQFTIEQIAGDMLPNATFDQRVATGFHRNTMLNEEGGIDPLEYRYYAMADRVATTGTVWLGLTTGCAQCHSHKYDPISHTDYYSLMALLNNADEPDMRVWDDATLKKRGEVEKRIAELEGDLPNQFPPAKGKAAKPIQRKRHLEKKFDAWLAKERPTAIAWDTLTPDHMETNLPKLELLDDSSIFSSGDVTKRDVFRLKFTLDPAKPLAALSLEVLPDERLPAGGPGRCYYEGRRGDFFLSEFIATIDGKPVKFADASHTFGKISIGSGKAHAKNVFDGKGSTGWSASGREGQRNQLVLNLADKVSGRELEIEMIFERHFVASLGRFRISATSMPGAKAQVMPIDVQTSLAGKDANAAIRDRLLKHFLSVAPELKTARTKIEQARKQIPKPSNTLVMLERPRDNPRKTHRHHRGEYLSAKEEVSPGVPDIFRPPSKKTPGNRLEFARWLVSDGNPLVGRVTVNRAWRAFFGHGLMRTSGDFGTQSDPPTHPQLLDWLAVEFVEQGWSLKKLHRMIVMSATYRQRSTLTADLLKDDPSNRLLARGPRFRVDAEMVRDMMLKASGLLSAKMYGAGVYPPQPASVTGLAYGNTKWNVSKGEDRYRRSIYTFSKRTAPFAAFTVFNGPTGESCVARRDRSNSPLQSLTLLNDEMYVELARALAREAERRTSNVEHRTSKDVATLIFRRLMTRSPSSDELVLMMNYQKTQFERLQKGELKASDILVLDVRRSKLDVRSLNESASWIMVARALMNLDEAITKQ